MRGEESLAAVRSLLVVWRPSYVMLTAERGFLWFLQHVWLVLQRKWEARLGALRTLLKAFSTFNEEYGGMMCTKPCLRHQAIAGTRIGMAAMPLQAPALDALVVKLRAWAAQADVEL